MALSDSKVATLILPAGPGDAEALGRVHVQSWRETYPDLLSPAFLERMSWMAHARAFRAQLMNPRAGNVILAAESPRGIVGYAAGVIDASGEAEVHTLYVLKSAQGQGLGRKLLTAAARALAGEGAASLELWVLAGNIPARGFYEYLGGREAGFKRERGLGGVLPQVLYRWGDIRALMAD